MGSAFIIIDSIVQALAPCHQAGCCTVIELVSRVLFMDYYVVCDNDYRSIIMP